MWTIMSNLKNKLKKNNVTKNEVFLLFALIYFYFLLLLLILLYFENILLKFILINEILLLVCFHFYYLIQNKIKNNRDLKAQINNYKQLESYISLVSSIKICHPLPLMRNSSISPDLANIIVSQMLYKKPKNILELGSGVSTLIVSYCINMNGIGHVWSLDNEKKYADISINNLKKHNLLEHATIIFSPLQEIYFENKKYYYYDSNFFNNINFNIDLLIIDGPPRKYSPEIRYLALPLLYNQLNKDAIIIIDDANRDGEKIIVQQWLDRYKNLTYEWFDTEKGTVILKNV